MLFRSEPRSAYRAYQTIPTRWEDNDTYGHVNNVVYYSWFDTAVNALNYFWFNRHDFAASDERKVQVKLVNDSVVGRLGAHHGAPGGNQLDERSFVKISTKE